MKVPSLIDLCINAIASYLADDNSIERNSQIISEMGITAKVPVCLEGIPFGLKWKIFIKLTMIENARKNQ